MKTFISATPLFKSDMSVEAYRLCYRSGKKLFETQDDHQVLVDALLSPGLDLVESLGIEPFTGGKPLFVEVNEYQLLMGVPANLNIPADKLVCLLPHNIYANPGVPEHCQRLHELGYGIAVDGITKDLGNPVFHLADFVMIDFLLYKVDEFFKLLKALNTKKRVVITNVPDMDVFKAMSNYTNALYSGTFYSQPVTKGITEISPLKINTLALLKQINEEDFDLMPIADIIGRDPSLSLSLLRFINNSTYNRGHKIDSIKNAVTVLGQKEVKRWATAALSLRLAEDRPNELARLSLLRARFAENLASLYQMGGFAPSLFMAGLFSLLDIILQKPMAEAVKEVNLNDSVSLALVEKKGELYEVLDLIYAYEYADWDSVAINMVKHSVELEDINTAFLNTLIWYKQLLDAINEDEARIATAH